MTAISFSKLQSLSDDNWQTINTVVSRIVVCGLILIIFYYSSGLFWRFFYPEGFHLPIRASKVLEVKPQAPVKWAWFEDTKVESKQKMAPSKLKAQLIGIVSQEKSKGQGVAMIRVRKKSAIFGVGDSVEGMTVKSIGADYVNLEGNGEIEVLRIRKHNVFLDKPRKKEKEGQKPPSGDKVTKLLEDISQEPTKITEFIQFEATEGNNKQEHFKVSPKSTKHQELFSDLGLEPGDVVVSVNGISISELKSKPASIDELLKSDLTVELLRDGNLTEVYIH